MAIYFSARHEKARNSALALERLHGYVFFPPLHEATALEDDMAVYFSARHEKATNSALALERL